MRRMGKVLHKLFKDVVNELYIHLLLKENKYQKCHYSIQNPGIFTSHRIIRIIQKGFVETNFLIYQNLINNKTFLTGEPEKGETVTQCKDFYKENTI